MKRSASVFVALVAVMALWVLPASAQAYGEVEVDIPFQFVAVNTTLPAGRYVIQRSDREDPAMWTLTNENEDLHVDVLTGDAAEPTSPQRTGVVFDELQGRAFLSQIWIAGEDPGVQVEQGRAEQRLLKGATMAPTHKTVSGVLRGARH